MHFKYTSLLNYFKAPEDEQGVKLSEEGVIVIGNINAMKNEQSFWNEYKEKHLEYNPPQKKQPAFIPAD